MSINSSLVNIVACYNKLIIFLIYKQTFKAYQKLPFNLHLIYFQVHNYP